MRQKIHHFSRKIRSFITRNFVSHAHRGSGLGVYLRRLLKHSNPQQIIGINLAGFAFFAGIVVPQTNEAFSNIEVALKTRETVVAINTAPTTYQWPLAQFGISQKFSYYHPGMDLTDPTGTPLYPIGDGEVGWVQQLSYGYGRHIFISHEGNVKSLYAHLSEIFVKEGDHVTKDTEIGKVGSTGHSTGSHLHLEVYDGFTPVNPLEVLPLLKLSSL